MADPNGLDISEVSFAQSPSFDRNGRMTNNTIVSFMVGQHGPFNLSYAPGEATPDRINADMAKQQADIRAVVTRG